jgi:hypothetical protein
MIRTGILFAVLSAALFGASTPLAKLLLGSVDPWVMAGVLYLGAGLGLAAVRRGRIDGLWSLVAVATARTVSCGSRPPAPSHQLST